MWKSLYYKQLPFIFPTEIRIITQKLKITIYLHLLLNTRDIRQQEECSCGWRCNEGRLYLVREHEISHAIQTDPEALQALCTMAIKSLLEVRRLEYGADHPLLSSVELRMGWSLYLHLLSVPA